MNNIFVLLPSLTLEIFVKKFDVESKNTKQRGITEFSIYEVYYN